MTTRDSLSVEETVSAKRSRHPACFITGANRGIGLALAAHSVNAGWSVVCACRDAAKGEEVLSSLRAKLAPKRQLVVVQLDIGGSLADCKQAGQEALEKLAGSGAQFEVLFNNAGVNVPTHPHQPITDTQIASKAEMLRVFEVNVVGTLQVCQALVHALGFKKVINVSSRQGSLKLAFSAAKSDGIPKGAGVYGVSKAAQNMLTRQLALNYEELGVIVASVSPGWVDTDMGGSGGRKPSLTPEQSAAGLFEVAERLTPEQTGHFLNWNGEVLPF